MSLTLPDPEPISGTCTSVLRYLPTYTTSSSVPERQVGIGVHFLSLRAPESGIKNTIQYNTCKMSQMQNREQIYKGMTSRKKERKHVLENEIKEKKYDAQE